MFDPWSHKELRGLTISGHNHELVSHLCAHKAPQVTYCEVKVFVVTLFDIFLTT